MTTWKIWMRNGATRWSELLGNPLKPVLVAWEGDDIRGFCSLMPSRDPDATGTAAEIGALYVDPHFWRTGYGTALVKAAVNHTRGRGFTTLSLWVLEGNAAARSFYEALGFMPDGHAKTEEQPGFTLPQLRYQQRLLEGGAKGSDE